jgi:hypothetical protein
MEDEKDRLGQKLRDLEKAREDQWAHEEDRKLIEKQRQKLAQQQKAAAAMSCPHCGKPLQAKSPSGIAIMACPENHGAWLGAGALLEILERKK